MTTEDWIKVEDRLPEADVDVLINYELDGIIRAYYDKDEGWMSSELGLLAEESVTHWMPIVYPKKD